jgi:hypothetical protein
MLDRLSSYQETTQKKAVHIFPMILDPRIKMSNFEDNNNNSAHPGRQIEEIQKAFYESSRPYSLYPIFRHNHQDDGNDMVVDPSSADHSSRNLQHHHVNKRPRAFPEDHHHAHHHHHHPSETDSDSDYSSGKPRIFKKKPKLMIGLKDEITNYLEVECEESTSVPLEYWKTNVSKFPSLSQMSKDFLAVQASTGLGFETCARFERLSESFLDTSSLFPSPAEHPVDPIQNHLQDSSTPVGQPPHSHNHPFSSAYPGPGKLQSTGPSSANPPPSSMTSSSTPMREQASFPIDHPRPSSSASSTAPATATPLDSLGFRLPSFQHPSTIEKDIIVHPNPSSSNPIIPPPSTSTPMTATHHHHNQLQSNLNSNNSNNNTQEIDPSLLTLNHLPLHTDIENFPSSSSALSLDLLDGFNGHSYHQFLVNQDVVCLYYWVFCLNLINL